MYGVLCKIIYAQTFVLKLTHIPNQTYLPKQVSRRQTQQHRLDVGGKARRKNSDIVIVHTDPAQHTS